MKTFVKSQEKFSIVNLRNDEKVNVQLLNPKSGLSNKFYQKLILIFFVLSTFLIFQESPNEFEILCKKYHSKEACIIW